MNRPAAAPAPRIRTHRAGTGLAWVQRGLRLFGRQPLMLVVLVGLGALLLLTISVIRDVGNFAFLILAPAVSLGALTICRSVDRGQPPASALYLTALRDPVARLRLLQLGLYSAIYVGLSSLLLSGLPGTPAAGGAASHEASPNGTRAIRPAGGADDAAAPTAPSPAAPAVPAVPAAPGTPLNPAAVAPDSAPSADADAPVPLPVFLAMVALLLPYTMTMWFAPVLSGWYGLSAPKALFFSFFACWRNRTAMLVYLITLLGIGVIAVLILGALVEILNVKAGLGLFLLVAPLGFVTTAIAQSANLEMIKDVIDTGADPGDVMPDTTVMPPA